MGGSKERALYLPLLLFSSDPALNDRFATSGCYAKMDTLLVVVIVYSFRSALTRDSWLDMSLQLS